MMSLSSESYTSSLKTWFSGLPLLSTSLKCSVHCACISSFLLRRLPFLSSTAVLCLGFSLHNILVSPYSVFMCWFLAASSASHLMFSIHFFLSVFILLFTSLFFSTYFALSCFLTLSDRVPRIFLLSSSLLVYEAPWLLTYPWLLLLPRFSQDWFCNLCVCLLHHLKVLFHFFIFFNWWWSLPISADLYTLVSFTEFPNRLLISTWSIWFMAFPPGETHVIFCGWSYVETMFLL